MMRFFLLFAALLVTFPSPVAGQKKPDYSVKLISPALLENSVAVVRNWEETFEITAVNRAERKIKYAVTILSKLGDSKGIFSESYDNNMTLGNVQAVIYDGDGKIIERVKSSDIGDFSATSSFSIYEDNRQKYYPPQVKNYPYTVEYEYGYSYRGLFHMPVWSPVPGYDVSVEQSTFRIVVPSELDIKFHERNLDRGVNVSGDSKNKIYEWNVAAIPAIESEDFSPSPEEFMPVVFTAPVQFEIGGYSGNMSDWKNFGLWQKQLLAGRDQLPLETIAEVENLVTGLGTDREKVKAVYRYVQNKTRYVSIQEGIGGWQPISALEVDQNGYGDCKALTNYTMALLKAIGIRSHYTKVRAAEYPQDIIEEFVSNQTNHVFLCVPLENDTVWLECTSQTSPFGYIGNFTDSRKVMLITEEGGEIVKSKRYPQELNRQVTNATVELNGDNTCSVIVDITCSGLQYDNIAGRISASYDDNRRWLYNNIGLTDFNLEEFNFRGEDEEPVAYAHQEIMVNNYSSFSGRRCFVQLNMFNRSTFLPEKLVKRNREVVLRFPYVDIDTIHYIIPEGFEVESIPDAKEVDTPFGRYKSSVVNNGKEIIYSRELRINAGRFPAEEYDNLREFYGEISRSDRSRMVLTKPQE